MHASLPPLRAADEAYTLELCVTRWLWKVPFCLVSLQCSLVLGCCSSFSRCSHKSTPLFCDNGHLGLEMSFKRCLQPLLAFYELFLVCFESTLQDCQPALALQWLHPTGMPNPPHLQRSWGHRRVTIPWPGCKRQDIPSCLTRWLHEQLIPWKPSEVMTLQKTQQVWKELLAGRG